MSAESMMYAVQPLAFNPAMLASTTAIEQNPLWDPGVTYPKDAMVVWVHADGAAVIYYIYQSLVSNNATEPGTDLLAWLEIGPCNKCAMFDGRVSTRTEAVSPLVVVLEPGDITSNLGLLNLIGNSLTVEMLVGGEVIYTQTVSLLGAEISDWWSYYFTPDEQVTLALFDSLPAFYNQQLRITLTGLGTVAIGHCVFGTRQDIGELQYGAQANVVDYSRKVTDEFGVTSFVERDYADEFSGQLLVQNAQLSSIKRLLRRLRATPTLYVGSSDERFRELFVAFGWVRSHRIAVPYTNESLLDIEIGALT